MASSVSVSSGFPTVTEECDLLITNGQQYVQQVTEKVKQLGQVTFAVKAAIHALQSLAVHKEEVEKKLKSFSSGNINEATVIIETSGSRPLERVTDETQSCVNLARHIALIQDAYNTHYDQFVQGMSIIKQLIASYEDPSVPKLPLPKFTQELSSKVGPVVLVTPCRNSQTK
ncbi:MAG: hypothetical protein HY861_03625 [Chlamydiia bacterium]|nr:hypothetical protein [Chlamydiia bacterium]